MSIITRGYTSSNIVTRGYGKDVKVPFIKRVVEAVKRAARAGSAVYEEKIKPIIVAAKLTMINNDIIDENIQGQESIVPSNTNVHVRASFINIVNKKIKEIFIKVTKIIKS